MKKILRLLTWLLILFLISGTALFIYSWEKEYKVNKDFTPLPLVFDVSDSSSEYGFENRDIIIKGGFVKGIQKGKNPIERLVLRALSPLPEIEIKDIQGKSGEINITLENINPEFVMNSLKENNALIRETGSNSVSFSLNTEKGGTYKIESAVSEKTENSDGYKFAILGDNRDGYDTFAQIIQQLNGIKPVFVIDNGDLVFSGKANQYRLFDRTVSDLASTLVTTLGNHDIRGENGRKIYTMLYGPSHYSFDVGDCHFSIVDSSPGWAEKTSISEDQYVWLENDLKKAEGKKKFVITHIPPTDPRGETDANSISEIQNDKNESQGFIESKLDKYSESKSMDHGFQDREEAAKFEKMMTHYKVNTVFLSHIHSYFDFNKDGVRYVITGGAGAELLSENSYYHYIIGNTGENINLTVIGMPSPANNYIARYTATFNLFAKALYEENPLAVTLILTGMGLLAVLIILRIAIREKEGLSKTGKFLKDITGYSVKSFRNIFGNKEK